ncbi:MAG: hypothetical protein K6B65_00525 [Bacilli bacterium]|nr:hypothetical protein [Bacilli bacterium]
MMASKFKKGLLILVASATMLLAGCDDVTAELPESVQEEALVVDGKTSGLPGNNLKEIWDSLVTSGDSNSEKILNNILYAYAESYFGAFYGEDGAVGLKDVYDDNSKAESFRSAHTSAYSTKEEVIDLANVIVKSIKESFWEFRNNSSYQDREVFYERLFYEAQEKNLYSFPEIAVGDFKVKQLLGDETPEKDIDLYFNDFLDTYQSYIKRNLIPNLYRKALIKDYLIRTNSGVLGRSYARKISYIALPDISSSASAAQNLIRAFCKLCLEADNVADEFRDLRFLDKLYCGTVAQTGDEWTKAQEVYTEAGWTLGGWTDETATDIDESKIYVESTMGATVKDYNELSDDRNISGSSTDFTNSGAYVKEIGLEIKERGIQNTSKVTEGWYNASSSLSLLNDLKDRLFKITVANEVDSDEGETFGKYVQGSYYMVPKTYERTESYPYAVYDKSSSTWYICRVDQAVKAAKLNSEGDESYDNANIGKGFGSDGKMSLNQVKWAVADLLADTDSYKNAANQEAVEKMALSFHDQEVYNYFVKTFPDLFE